MKKNDVYHINYTEQYRKTHRGDLHHCFEGLAVVHEKADGGFILIDTFWGIGRSDNKCFNIDQIDKDITAELYCNLDEIEKSVNMIFSIMMMLTFSPCRINMVALKIVYTGINARGQ